MFSSDVTFFRMHQPFFAIDTANSGDRRMTVYFRSHVASSRSHGLGNIGRFNLSVLWVDDPTNQAIRIA